MRRLNYTINIGNLKIHEGVGLGTEDNEIANNAVQVLYPSNNSNQLTLKVNWPVAASLKYTIYSLDGKSIVTKPLATNTTAQPIDTANLSRGIYLLTVESTNGQSLTKKMIVK